jgi:predicted AlkP superfamily pyrophosphatase or phosphodiesterase
MTFAGLRRTTLLLALLLAVGACRPQQTPPAPATATDRPIVILISIDGFRWDYLDRYAPPNLMKLAAAGVRSDALIPQFPSKTFPNHYTIVTGLTLAHHGIVSNNMKAPDIPGEFSLSNRDVQNDPRWWGGEPIWNTAERQGLKAAAMFWPGSEVLISGRRGSYWTPYEDGMPHEQRLRRVLGWLGLPEAERPSFVTLYFSDVDTAGHRHGPDSDETAAAVTKVDRSIGELVTGVERAGLNHRVHYVIVSDHGMSALSSERTIVLDNYIDVSKVDVIDWSPMLGVNALDGDNETLYLALKDKHPALTVYRNSEIPERYGLANHPRVPAVFGVAKDGWRIASKRDVRRWVESLSPAGGAHGYDVTEPSMHGLFIAAGPRIRPGVRVKPIENLHIYEFMCAILGLQPAKNDGDPAATRDMLR